VAIGILLLLTGNYWVQGVIALLLAIPFVALLRFVEYKAEHGKLPELLTCRRPWFSSQTFKPSSLDTAPRPFLRWAYN